MSKKTGTKSLATRTLRGIGWSSLSQIARQIIQMGVIAVLARLLTPRAFGLVGMITIFSAFINIFSELGLGSAVIQQKELDKDTLSSVFWMNVLTGLLLSCLMAVCAPAIASFYGEPKLKKLAMAIGLTFFISSFGIVQKTLLTKELSFGKLFFAEITSMVVAGVFAIFLALRGWGVWSLVVQSLSAIFVTVLALWYLTRWQPQFVFKWASVKQLLGFGLNLLGFQFINYFARNADNLLIGKFIGAAALGYYDRAYQFMLYPLQNVSNVLGRVLFPALSIIQEDLSKVRAIYLRATLYISVVSFPMMLGLLVVAPEVIRILFGAQWEASIPVLQILCPVGLIQSIVTTVGWIYLSQGRTDIQFKFILCTLPVRIGAFFMGIRWGIQGIAAAYAISVFFLMFPNYYISFRIIKLSIVAFFRNFTSTMITSLGMMVIVFGCRFYLKHSLQVNDVVILFSCFGVGIVSYVGLLMLFGRQLLRKIWLLVIQMKVSNRSKNTEL